jgi:SWI/SNF-related matrix-associated actin-dependent regulator 1 of chromatin subfamily A
MSYGLATNKVEEIERKKFQTIICDEAHYLKSRVAKRTKALCPVLQKAKRIILLTGTPILAKPAELYNLLDILRPDICPPLREFTARYGRDYADARCTDELHYLMKTVFMVRRMKKDVLDQLPDKRRQKIQIEADAKVV